MLLQCPMPYHFQGPTTRELIQFSRGDYWHLQNMLFGQRLQNNPHQNQHSSHWLPSQPSSNPLNIVLAGILCCLNKFYQLQTRMWGLCQNVEIIHQHHHHFYELVLPNKSRNRSLLSKTQSLNDTPSPEYIPASSHPSSLGTLKEPSTSTIYRSKRAYLSGTQRGIDVLSRKQDHSFQLSRINLQTPPTNQHQICPPKQGPHTPLTPRQASHQIHQQVISRRVINDDYAPVKMNPNQISVTLDQSIQKSTPTVCRNPNSHQASLKASHYFNLHQLKQSTINFKNASVCQTKKKHRENPSSIHHAVSLSAPAETGTTSKNYHHQSSEIYLRNTDSIATKKENGFLSAFKTEKMFDDAKSIISMESLQHSQLNIDESIIISRTMDYFANISHKRQLPHCCLYLARDNRVNWLVSVREFEFKHEEAAMKEAKLHGLISLSSSQEGREWPVLTLYRVMMEGSGLSKSIFFIQEPFESLLNEHIQPKKTYYKAVPSAFNCFLHDLAEQTLKALSLLAQKRLFLMESLEIGDFTIVNGMFKLHSLCKFQLANQGHEQSREEMLGYVQKLKSAIIQTVIFS